MLYLAYAPGVSTDPPPEGPWTDLRPLAPDLLVIESEQERSAVYHALKPELAPGAALVVTRLAEVPKVRHGEPGIVAWMKARADQL